MRSDPAHPNMTSQEAETVASQSGRTAEPSAQGADDLFRPEAVRHLTRRIEGGVLLPNPVGARILTGLAVAVLVTAATFLATASYTRRTSVTGWVRPEAGLIRVTAREGGVIEEVAVREGQVVDVGETIARLRLSSPLSGGDSLTSIQDSLRNTGLAAADRAAGGGEMLEAELRDLQARLPVISAEIAEIEKRITLQSDRVALARTEVERAETIAAQGFLPRRELDARRGTALIAQQELSELRGSRLALQRERQTISARLTVIPIERRAIETELRSTRADLARRGIESEAMGAYRVVAPVAGKIAALPVQVGQTTAANSSIAVLTPGGSTLEVELFAPSRAAGFIREGQTVRLKYEAFPYQKFGVGEGEVSSVSRTVLAPGDVIAAGLDVSEPVFRVKVRLDRPFVEAYGQKMPLQPGMLVAADIVIDRRNLFEWVLDPLYAAGRR